MQYHALAVPVLVPADSKLPPFTLRSRVLQTPYCGAVGFDVQLGSPHLDNSADQVRCPGCSADWASLPGTQAVALCALRLSTVSPPFKLFICCHSQVHLGLNKAKTFKSLICSGC